MNIFYKLVEKIIIRFCSNDKYVEILRKRGAKIGEGCLIDKSVNFSTEGYMISIGNRVRITSGVRLIPHDGGLWTLRQMGLMPNADYFAPIYIGDNVHIGNDAIIMPGISIGKNSIIACNAVVTKDVAEGTIVGGVPAKVIETIDEYYQKKKDKCDNTKNMTSEQKREYYKNKYKIN